MKTKMKRALSAVLTCAMMVAMLPAFANAANAAVTFDLKDADASSTSAMTEQTVVVKDSAGNAVDPDVATAPMVYTLQDDATYTVTASAKGYESAELKDYKPATGGETKEIKLNPQYDITYYDHEGKLLSTDAPTSTYKLDAAYKNATKNTYNKELDLPTAEPYAYKGYVFTGWVVKSTTTPVVTKIDATDNAPVELQATYEKTVIKSASIKVDSADSITLDASAKAKDQKIPTYGTLTVAFDEKVYEDKKDGIVSTFTILDEAKKDVTPDAKNIKLSTDGKTLTVDIKSDASLKSGKEYTIQVTAGADKAEYAVTAMDCTLTLENATWEGKAETKTFTVPYGTKIDLYERNSKYLPQVSSGVAYGWYTEKDGKGTYTKEVTMTKDITLYASFDYPTSQGGSNDDFGKVHPRLDKTRTGYISGYSDGSIKPNANMTRAEVASMFYRLVNDSTLDAYETSKNSFTDVSSDFWANNAISTLCKAGVLKGYEDGTFKPNATITRAELVTIISRLESSATMGQTTLTDLNGHWAKDAIVNACNWGVVTGYPDNTFRPNNNVTRAEAVAMINRVMARKVDTSALTSTMKTFTDNQDTSAWYYIDMQVAAN